MVVSGTISPPNGSVYPPGTRTVPYAWKLDLPGDCNTNLPWRNGILGTGYLIGPIGYPGNDGKPHAGLYGRDAADDLKLEASGGILFVTPGRYTLFAYGSCVSASNSAQRIEFETPRTTFLVKSRLSVVNLYDRRIGDVIRGGFRYQLACGSNCYGGTLVATLLPGRKELGRVTISAPPPGPLAPFLPLPNQKPRPIRLTAAGKARLAALARASIGVTATVRLGDGETQVVTSKLTLTR